MIDAHREARRIEGFQSISRDPGSHNHLKAGLPDFDRPSDNNLLLSEAISNREASEVRVQRLKENWGAVQERITAHLTYLDDRANREQLGDAELESMMVNATLDGYRDGLAENRGIIYGRRNGK